jgi:Methylene-tetrahydrofolate reductase C terminal
MIVVRQKPLKEIVKAVAPYRRILLVGCNTCAAVSLAGGELEVDTLVQTLRLASSQEGTGSVFEGAVLQRQCEPEFIEKLEIDDCDALLSLGCGAGVALLADNVDIPVIPALDTMFIGSAKGLASWRAECSACGSCVLGETAGICPITRCAKGILNGPCGGVNDGMCELGDRECAWVLIHDRLAKLHREDEFETTHEPKDYSVKTKNPEWDAHARGGDR